MVDPADRFGSVQPASGRLMLSRPRVRGGRHGLHRHRHGRRNRMSGSDRDPSDGSAWTTQVVNQPNASDSGLDFSWPRGVCARHGGCVWPSGPTAGDIFSFPLAFRCNGSAWSNQSPKSGDQDFESVACVSVQTCTVIGEDGHGGSCAQTWNRSSWSSPSSSFDGIVTEVSCVPPHFCVAVGSANTGGSWPQSPPAIAHSRCARWPHRAAVPPTGVRRLIIPPRGSCGRLQLERKCGRHRRASCRAYGGRTRQRRTSCGPHKDGTPEAFASVFLNPLGDFAMWKLAASKGPRMQSLVRDDTAAARTG